MLAISISEPDTASEVWISASCSCERARCVRVGLRVGLRVGALVEGLRVGALVGGLRVGALVLVFVGVRVGLRVDGALVGVRVVVGLMRRLRWRLDGVGAADETVGAADGDGASDGAGDGAVVGEHVLVSPLTGLEQFHRPLQSLHRSEIVYRLIVRVVALNGTWAAK